MDYTKDGYVDLTAIDKQWRKCIKNNIIVINDLCGPYYQGYWLKLDNRTFFLKIPRRNENVSTKMMYSEILLEEIARAIGIQTIESKIALLDAQRNYRCILSESYLRDNDDIYSGDVIITEYLDALEKTNDKKTNENAFFEFFGVKNKEELFDKIDEDPKFKYNVNSLDFIWASLEYHFREFRNKKEIVSGIMQKLVKRYIFQFIMMQQDFHLANWEIAQTSSTAHLVPLYDMDMAFSSSFEKVSKNNSIRSYMVEVEDIYEDIKRFYTSSSPDFKGEFIRQINILNEEVIEECINNIEKQYNYTFPDNIKELYLKMFKEHRERIIESLNLNNKVR